MSEQQAHKTLSDAGRKVLAEVLGESYLARRDATNNDFWAPVRAFSDYTRALTSWRPLPYIDPGLPREYLPKAWAGDKATETFFALHDRLARPSMQFVEEVTSR